MNPRQSQLDRLIARTRQRLLIADAVRLGGLWLAITTALALILAVGDRFLALGLGLWLLGAVALAGLPIAAVAAWRRRADVLEVAARLDATLRLKDRLGTAVAVDQHDGAMAQLVREQAQQIAARVDPRAVNRITWPPSWGAAGLCLAACAALLWLVEPRNVFARPRRASEIAAVEAARQQAADSLRRRADELRADLPGNDAIAPEHQSEAARQALNTLDRLAEQFSTAPRESGAPHDSKTQRGRESDAEFSLAAREAIELAERLERDVALAREAQRQAVERLGRLPKPIEPGQADEFMQSLREGDLNAAAEWLDSLEQRLHDAPQEEREAVAQALRDAAGQMESVARPREDRAEDRPPRAMPADAEVSEQQIEKWLEHPPSLDEIRRTLREQGRDPIDAQQMAEQIERNLRERVAEDRARRQIEDAAQRVRDLAETVQSPPAQEERRAASENAQGEVDGQGVRNAQDVADPRSGEGTPPRGDETRPVPGEKPEGGPVPREQPGAAPGQQQGAKPVERPGEKPDVKPRPDAAPAGADKPEGSPIAEQGAAPQPGQPPPSGEEAMRATPPGGDGEKTPNPAGLGGEQAETDGPGEQPPQPPPTIGDRARNVREILEEIDRSGRFADRDQEISQEMRDAAKELLEQMSPQEREEIARWAAQKAREMEGGGPGDMSPGLSSNRSLPTQAIDSPPFDFETDEVDLVNRDEGVNDRVIAEMYGPEEPRPQGEIDRHPMAARQVREAAQAIERALNEEAIPARYRTLIRNWARRLPQTIESQERRDE